MKLSKKLIKQTYSKYLSKLDVCINTNKIYYVAYMQNVPQSFRERRPRHAKLSSQSCMHGYLLLRYFAMKSSTDILCDFFEY